MKKIIFISVLFFVTCILQAQTTVTTTGGTANYVTKFNGAYTVVNSSIYDNGSIGIGTTSPSGRLHINGASIPGTRGSQLIASDNGSNRHILYTSVSDGRAMYYMYNSTGTLTNYFDTYGNSYINGGNVGIGTTSPGSALDVKGTLRLSGSTSGYVGFAPAAAAGSTTYTLPSADGSSGQVLQTNGSGTLSWLTTSTPSTGWQITGNSGTTDGTHFVGTTDNVALNFRVYNNKAGRIDQNGPTFFGYQAGNSNTATGSTGIGFLALFSNTSGNYNTATGDSALYSNTTGYNHTAIGFDALNRNTTGNYNTAIGCQTLKFNTTGNSNTAIGDQTLSDNTTGSENTAVGVNAMAKNILGNYNTAVGISALTGNIYSGNYNTCIGYRADENGDYSNATAIGYSSEAQSNNYVRVGNSSVTTAWVKVNWTIGSDARIKNNIQHNVPGLDFIKLLKPVTYHYDIHEENNLMGITDTANWVGKYDIEAIQFTGFIAQQVDSVAQSIGYDFSGVDKPKNPNDIYGLRYSEFVVPLVKAVQEQQKMIDSLMQHQRITDSLLVALQNHQPQGTLNKNLQNNDNEQENVLSNHNIELANNAVLYQNAPNPFSDGTVIKYFVPSSADAQLIFYDEFGSQLKVFKIEEKGMGQLNVSSSNLAAGMYTYSLIVNGKIIDTKKMLKQ